MKRFVSAAIASAIVWLGAPAQADTTLHVGAATVAKTGSGAQSVILIPGLGCGSYVYDAVVHELAERYTVYAVSFAGFDGNRAIQAPYLDAFTRSITALIAQEKLARPILVGHSLGGHVALQIAERAPGSIGAVLAIDTLPLFPPPQPGETPATRQAQVRGFVQSMQVLSDIDYANSERRAIAQLTAPANVDLVLNHTLRGDRMTTLGAAGEMMTADLRPALGDITAPVEVLVPVPATVPAQTMLAYYANAFTGTKALTTVPIADSKHFIMLDQPDAFRTELDRFLAANTPAITK